MARWCSLRSPFLLPVLPLLILLWTQNSFCLDPKSSHRLRAALKNVVREIQPPEGLEWLNSVNDDGEELDKIVRNRQPKRRRTSSLREEEEFAFFEVEIEEMTKEEKKNEQKGRGKFEDNDGPELGEPIPWFDEWERMVAKEKEEEMKKKSGLARRLHKIKSAAKNKKNSNHDHQLSSLSNLPAARRTFRNIREGQPCLLRRKNPVQHRTYPRSYEFPGFELSIPREWDWRNVSGINYCSPNRNQHIPVYCGGCWVFGTLGMLNDRFNIARKNRWPMTFLSPQEIIACNGRGSCNGGTAEDVFEHAKTVGLVEEGCNNFKAVNEKCTPFARCGSCWPDNCFAIQNYTRYYIKDFGKVSGRLQMMSEIHNRGPIACSMGCTGNFDMNYTMGIYQEFGEFQVNHIVSVTGWGWDEETKTEYWIVRNSWGDAWGENGWFRIVTSLYKNGRGDQYNLGIERECYLADPDTSNLDN